VQGQGAHRSQFQVGAGQSHCTGKRVTEGNNLANPDAKYSEWTGSVQISFFPLLSSDIYCVEQVLQIRNVHKGLRRKF
jgi:hypothetical protein